MAKKYIVTTRGDGIEEIFIFPSTVDHDAMMESLESIKNQTCGNWDRIFRLPISAGFTDGIKCWGRSETLNLNSRTKDSEILSKQ
jgi:hypothetical protein